MIPSITPMLQVIIEKAKPKLDVGKDQLLTSCLLYSSCSEKCFFGEKEI